MEEYTPDNSKYLFDLDIGGGIYGSEAERAVTREKMPSLVAGILSL